MLHISELNQRVRCLLLSFSILRKAERSQMSALFFKLFNLSYSILNILSLREKNMSILKLSSLYICNLSFLDADQRCNRRSA